jgi:group II intron reverse transcriptase/maturase
MDPSLVIYGEGHQWYWSAPFNYMNRSDKVAIPVEMGYKGIGLSDAERLGECSMPITVLWENPMYFENEYQPKSVMVCLYTFIWVSTALVSINRDIRNYLIIFIKVQLISISTTRRSLQLVGQNVKPKTEDIGSCRNWGFPKGSNSYLLNGNEGGCKTIGNGGFVVMSNHEGNQLSNFCLLPAGRRFYSLDNKQKINPEIKQDIEISYKQLFELDIYKSAYQSLKSKPGNMTPGTDKETLDGISIQWAADVIKSMKDRTFQFKPSERVYIPKNNGKLRPLGIPSPRDKVTQEAIRMMFQSVFEPIFLDTSHGFRPKRSTTTAVFEVRKWNGVTLIIEGDIKGFFDNIDHQILANLLMKKIKDKNLIDLYWKLVNAGYVNDGKFTKSHLGVPQGGVLSPLLSNIYLHEFDLFMKDLMEKYTDSTKVSKANPVYVKLRRDIKKLANQGAINEQERNTLAKLTGRLKKTPSVIRTKNTGTRVYYNRYADDWLIGITGDLEFAKKIKEEVNNFLKDVLKVELSQDKTKITHITQDKVNYLGFLISRRSRVYSESQISYVESTGTTWRPSNVSIVIEAPIEKLMLKLIEQGYAWEKDRMPKAMTKWIFLNPEDIIRRYNWVIRGILEYYKSVENRNQLGRILWILKFSAVYTLSRKLNISSKKVWKKYGNPIKIKFMTGKTEKSITLFSPETLKRDRTFKLQDYFNFDPFNVTMYTLRSNHVWDMDCLVCGAKDNVEMHHVKHIRKGDIKGFTKIMQILNRKQIPVCRDCHMKIHRGTYDGISLNKLVGLNKS